MSVRSVIEIEGLQISRASGRDRRIVLDNVSFSVLENQIGVVTGPNGAGKTTLFEALIGSLTPDFGTIRIAGREPRQAEVGVVWQRTYQSLMPWLSLLDNIALPLRFAGVRRRERRRRVHELCERTQVTVPLDRPPQAASGGEQQKACIMRALILGASVLLMDEPFANVGYDSSIELLEYLQRIQANSGLTILMSSHSPELTVFMADIIVPFRSTPVRVTPQDLIKIDCPYPSPRPLRWIHEPTFHEQLRGTRTETAPK